MQAGSQSNPFTTIAAAFAAGVALGLATGIVFLPPGAAVVENVTFPLTGNWEIATQHNIWVSTTAGITGNIDVTCSATARRALTNLVITGNVSGNAVGGASRLILMSTYITGTTTLTGTASAVWRVICRSAAAPCGPIGQTDQNTIFQGNCSIVGSIYGTSVTWSGSATLTFSQSSHLQNCNIGTSITATATASLWLNSCTYGGGASLTFTATSGTLTVYPDGGSQSELLKQTLLTVGTIVWSAVAGARSIRTTAANNIGASAVSQRSPASLMVAHATLTLLTPGTAGNAVLNLIYTDLAGVVQTKALTGVLNVASAAGTEVSGQLIFSQNGATAINYSVTGITTPGALSYAAGVAVEQVS